MMNHSRTFIFLKLISMAYLLLLFAGCGGLSSPAPHLASSAPSVIDPYQNKVRFSRTDPLYSANISPKPVSVYGVEFSSFAYKLIRNNDFCSFQAANSFTEATTGNFSVAPAQEGSYIICAIGKYTTTSVWQTPSESSISPLYVVDMTPPQTSPLLIQNGNLFTQSLAVILTLPATGASEMSISNVSCASLTSWIPYSSLSQWTLVNSNANNTVFVKYRDQALNETSCLQASITHDNVAPSAAVITSPANMATLTSTVGANVDINIQCEANANLNVTGFYKTTASCVSGVTHILIPFALFADGNNDLQFQVVDLAGNIGPTVAIRYIKMSQIVGVGIVEDERTLLAGSGAQKFTVALSQTAATDTTVNYLVTSDASAGVQDLPSTGSVIVPAGQLSAAINFNLTGAAPAKAYSLLRLTLVGDQKRSKRFMSDVIIKSPATTTTISAITSGESHTCTLDNTNVMRCFGDNLYQQVAASATTPFAANVTVPGTILKIQAGGFLSCGTKIVGAVEKLYCQGQISPGYTSLYDMGGSTISTINFAVGLSHVCTVLADGSLKCWGDNSHGQLGGVASPNPSAMPANINLGAGRTAKAVTAGDYHTCVILDDNSVKCFGANTFGQLGTGAFGDVGLNAAQMTALQPVNLGAGRTAKVIEAGGSHTCAILDDDSLKCWGKNQNGQLGYEDLIDRGTSVSSMTNLAAIFVGTGVKPVKVSAGKNHTCILLNNASVKCWGDNTYSELGYGDYTPRGGAVNSMTYLTTLNFGAKTVKDISAGGAHTCAILSDDSVSCWGKNTSGQRGPLFRALINSPVPIFGLSYYKTLQAGSFQTCGITFLDKVECWGTDFTGSLGDGKGLSETFPLGTATDVSFGSLRVGVAHACALQGSDIYCWGSNQYGQLGTGNTTDSWTPAKVSGGHSFKSLALGGQHTCAIDSTDSLWCWGRNQNGQLGLNSTTDSSVPMNVDVANTYLKLSLGGTHSCGIVKTTNMIKCWGSNSSNQIDATVTTQYLVPQSVDAFTYLDVTAGASHTCAIRSGSGQLFCMGANGMSQAGQDPASYSKVPGFMAVVSDANAYSSISAGSTFNCGIRAGTNALYCWGDNTSGNLGANSSVAGNAQPLIVMSGTQFLNVSGGGRHACATTTAGVGMCWGYNLFGQAGEDGFARSDISIQSIMKYIISP